MIFKSIELINFRQFKNIKIEFSTDPKKNVTFVTGEITSGKSTLIKAFLWTLYRDNHLFDDKILLSQLEKENMIPGKDKVTKVEIILEHDKFDYKIITSESYYADRTGYIGIKDKASTRLVKIPPDGSAITLTNESADLEINDILKKDLSPYFFFDGETSNIEKLVETKNIKQAISDIMGLKPIEMLKKLTNETSNDGVYQLVSKELVSTNNEALEKLKIDNANLITDTEVLDNQITENNEEIKKLSDQRNEIEKIIESNKDVEKDVEEKRRLLAKIEILRRSITEDYENVIALLNNPFKSLSMFFSNLFEEFNLEKVLKSSKLITDKSLTDIDAKAIDQIIKRGYCVCGEKIKPGSEHLKHLLDQKNFIAPKNYGKAIEEFLYEQNDDAKKREDFLSLFNSNREELINNIRAIENAKLAIVEIDKRIRNRPDVSQYKEKLKTYELQIHNLEKTNENLSGKLEEMTKRIRKNNEEIKVLTIDSSGNETINRRLSYILEVNQKTTNYLANKTKKVIETLNSYVSEAFEIMFNGERKITIDENFKVKTFLKNGNADLDESSGLKTVKNFSFVSGLIKCSKEFSYKKDEMDHEYDGKHPLVMDAPFSKLGEEPIKKVSKQIPEMCDQIIIFVLNKDFQISRESMKNRIGKEYKIKKLIGGKESVVEEI